MKRDLWVVKTKGGYVEIEADDWDCGGNGLVFKKGGIRVGWFREFEFFAQKAVLRKRPRR